MSIWSWTDFIAGWAGGVAGLVVGHPADTIKVRQQAFLQYDGALNTFSRTVRYEGIHGLYKGLSFPLVSAGLLNALFFGAYGNVLRASEYWVHGRDVIQTDTCPTPKSRPNLTDVFLAACAGGVVATFAACPVEVVKIQMQSQTGSGSAAWGVHHEPRHQGVIDCCLSIYRQRGISGFYRAFGTMLVRDVPSFGLYMVTYKYLACKPDDNSEPSTSLQIVAGGCAGIQLSPVLPAFAKLSPDPVSYGVYMLLYEAVLRRWSQKEDDVGIIVMAGGLSGVVSWAMITPIDVVKSRLQADDPERPQYRSAWHCARVSYSQGGLRVFFRGFWMMVGRSFPVNAATFVVYEWCLKHI